MRDRSRRFPSRLGLMIALLGLTSLSLQAQTIKLPPPQTDGGIPLMQALKARRSSRAFLSKPLPDQTLSNLLWAAFGVNRPDGRRTAPSAHNWQEIDIYVARADGLYLYLPKEHALQLVLKEDVRGLTGVQEFVREAPVNLIYVADFDRMKGATEEDKQFYSAADTGFIAQNVYLFCASEGLATVVRGTIDRPKLAAKMGLRPAQRITLAQTVGFPKE